MHVVRLQRQMFRKQTLRIGHCQSNINSQCRASHDCYHWRSRSAKADARTLKACAVKHKPIANRCLTIWLCYNSFLDVPKKKDSSAKSVLASKVEVQWCQRCLPTTISEHVYNSSTTVLHCNERNRWCKNQLISEPACVTEKPDDQQYITIQTSRKQHNSGETSHSRYYGIIPRTGKLMHPRKPHRLANLQLS